MLGAVTATAPSGEPLVGRVVRLDRMTLDDVPGLHRVFSNPDNYADGYAMSTPNRTFAETEETVRGRMAKSEGHVAYTARLISDGTVVGTSAIGDVDVEHERAHIGWTMWDRPWWGTAVNPEAKLLMLAHCFEDCGTGRVKIQTDAVNHHSQAAIAKLGATREGVLRRHVRRADGSWRDTVVFSILVDEWPAVRAGLERRLQNLT
jgi:RimJ/RimL family protein N-acetyltransferase